MSEYIDIVFDGPPSQESCRFVEVENDQGASIRLGEWIERDGGEWVLRIQQTAVSPEALDAAVLAVRDLDGPASIGSEEIVVAALTAGFPILQAQAKADELQAAYDVGLVQGAADALKTAAELIAPHSGIGLAYGANRAEISAWLGRYEKDIRGKAPS